MAARRRADFCIAFTTYSRGRVGSAIIEALLAGRLAACIQVVPIRSHYRWKGKAAQAREHLMLIKARAADFGRVKAAILRHHDYEVPEVVCVEVSQGSADYIGWMSEATKRGRRAR
jgi:periplasmic divalent cation tolerance protein